MLTRFHNLLLILAGVFALALWVFLNISLAPFLGFWLIALDIIFLLGSLMIASYLGDFSLPVVKTLLRREYYRIKFKKKQKAKQGAYLKFLAHLIILFQSAEEGFEVIKEEAHEIHGKALLFVKNEKKKGKQAFDQLKQIHLSKQRRAAALSASALFLFILGSLFTALFSVLIYQNISSSRAATYAWVQTDWSGGVLGDQAACESANGTWDAANSVCVAVHADNQIGWTAYGSGDSEINTDNNEIKINLTSGSDTQTDDASGFLSGTHSNTYSSGTGILPKKDNSAVCSADVQCASGNCDADFSSGSYCHATDSSCVYYAGGDPWELDNGWEQCSGNDYFKSCSNGSWGAQQNNPDPSDDYCDAGGGAQTGYDLAATCASGLSGGFTDPSCVSCSPYKAASTNSCKESCATDDDCWSVASCISGSCVDPCDGVASVSYSGETYQTVGIGTQCWFAENLNVGSRINGGDAQTNNGTIEKYCYNDSESNCDTYGGLYYWDEAMQYSATEGAQGICPTGWHIPSDSEFKTLEMELGMSQTEANDMIWRGTDEGAALAGNETLWADGVLDSNARFGESGFNALPAGDYSTWGYLDLHSQATFWTSSEGRDGDDTEAFWRYLEDDECGVQRNDYSKMRPFSARCLKD